MHAVISNDSAYTDQNKYFLSIVDFLIFWQGRPNLYYSWPKILFLLHRFFNIVLVSHTVQWGCIKYTNFRMKWKLIYVIDIDKSRTRRFFLDIAVELILPSESLLFYTWYLCLNSSPPQDWYCTLNVSVFICLSYRTYLPPIIEKSCIFVIAVLIV